MTSTVNIQVGKEPEEVREAGIAFKIKPSERDMWKKYKAYKNYKSLPDMISHLMNQIIEVDEGFQERLKEIDSI